MTLQERDWENREEGRMEVREEVRRYMIGLIKKLCKKNTPAEVADIVELSKEIVSAVITAFHEECLINSC